MKYNSTHLVWLVYSCKIQSKASPRQQNIWLKTIRFIQIKWLTRKCLRKQIFTPKLMTFSNGRIGKLIKFVSDWQKLKEKVCVEPEIVLASMVSGAPPGTVCIDHWTEVTFWWQMFVQSWSSIDQTAHLTSAVLLLLSCRPRRLELSSTSALQKLRWPSVNKTVFFFGVQLPASELELINTSC